MALFGSRRLKTPKISPLVLSFCKGIVSDALPFFVPIKPAPNARPGKSFENVTETVSRFGGGLFRGWEISECSDYLLAQFVAVWFSSCGTLDITPRRVGDTILFLPDLKMKENDHRERLQPKTWRGTNIAIDRMLNGPPVFVVLPEE